MTKKKNKKADGDKVTIKNKSTEDKSSNQNEKVQDKDFNSQSSGKSGAADNTAGQLKVMEKELHTAEEKLQKIQADMEAKETELDKLNEKYIRLAAEFDNFRKRTEKERIQLHTYAGEKVLKEILPILDDIERAVNDQSGKSGAHSSAGLGLIHKKFLKTLNDLGVKPIEALGKPFDPDLHHAVMSREVEDVESETVVEEFEKGYLYQDRVLRYAKVVVSK